MRHVALRLVRGLHRTLKGCQPGGSLETVKESLGQSGYRSVIQFRFFCDGRGALQTLSGEIPAIDVVHTPGAIRPGVGSQQKCQSGYVLRHTDSSQRLMTKHLVGQLFILPKGLTESRPDEPPGRLNWREYRLRPIPCAMTLVSDINTLPCSHCKAPIPALAKRHPRLRR